LTVLVAVSINISATDSIHFHALIIFGQHANVTASKSNVVEGLEYRSLRVPLGCRAVSYKSHGDNVEITVSVTEE
jgi:uncharacterized protein involved in propanediol utilization